MANKKCACGEDLHYTDPEVEETMHDIVMEKGEYITVKMKGGESYKVQRHYIALHGLKYNEVAIIGEEIKKN